MSQDKTKEEILSEYLTCTCDEAYINRQMADPSCPLHSYGPEIIEAMESYAQQVADRKSGWVKVKEKEPEKMQLVLIIVDGKTHPAQFDGLSFNRYPNDATGDRCSAYYYNGVTHWQPLPSPPKELE